MRARDHELAVAEQISEHPVEFRMTFPTSAKVEEPGGCREWFCPNLTARAFKSATNDANPSIERTPSGKRRLPAAATRVNR
jgi:hypothetical protein